jgi:hypothetical protein
MVILLTITLNTKSVIFSRIIYLYIPRNFQNKHPLFPYTAFIDCSFY